MKVGAKGILLRSLSPAQRGTVAGWAGIIELLGSDCLVSMYSFLPAFSEFSSRTKVPLLENWPLIEMAAHGGFWMAEQESF